MIYIHNNPKSIGFEYDNYKYSSYQAIVGNQTTLIEKESLKWFDSLENFKFCHNQNVEIDWFE